MGALTRDAKLWEGSPFCKSHLSFIWWSLTLMSNAVKARVASRQWAESRRICNVPEDALLPPSLVHQPSVIFPLNTSEVEVLNEWDDTTAHYPLTEAFTSQSDFAVLATVSKCICSKKTYKVNAWWLTGTLLLAPLAPLAPGLAWWTQPNWLWGLRGHNNYKAAMCGLLHSQ